jgi:DNA-binding transcriptional MerR regulator/quercetin dioxygenase-like cupin family protein
MAFTVKQVAEMSNVSVRTLHFYDETGLVKPAYHGANGYRYYEEAQLLILQQVLFYRELGFELRQIREILGRAEFEQVAALESHREVLQQKLTRSRALLGTIEKTISHLKGTAKMKSEEIFAGFSVGAGCARFDAPLRVGGEPYDCKVSGKDNDGAMCVFEVTGRGTGPRHLHEQQDEWIYVIQGEIALEVGGKPMRAGAGESVFIPRGTAHAWVACGPEPAKVINTYQPAGSIEEFFHELDKYNDGPVLHEVLSFEGLHALFRAHGARMTGPPLVGEWTVDEKGMIQQGG